eukprot:547914_1
MVSALLLYLVISMHQIYINNGSTVLCGQTISNFFYSYCTMDTDLYQPCATHLYKLTIDNEHSVNIDSCASVTDIWINVYDHNFFNKLSYPYCTSGNDCGHCTNHHIKHSENYTIPYLPPNQYFIEVGGYGIGPYQINIECNARLPANNVNKSAYLPPNTMTSVTKSNVICGSKVNGELHANGNDSHYYLFNLANDYSVTFDIWYTGFFTIIYLYDIDLNIIYATDAIYSETLGYASVMSIPNLSSGIYILRIAGYLDLYLHYALYGIEIICYRHFVSQYFYEVPSYEFAPNWYSAETWCEKEFGTSMATVITTTDMENVISSLPEYLLKGNVSFWVGMFTNFRNISNREWVTKSGELTETHINNVDSLSSKQYGVHLYFSNAKRQAFYMTPTTDAGMVLCNGIRGTYNLPNCTNSIKCWNTLDKVEDSRLIDDIIKADALCYEFCHFPYVGNEITDYPFINFQPPVAYWNSTLFVLGLNELHFTEFVLLEQQHKWHHKLYNHNNLVPWKLNTRYAQFQSSLYLYCFNVTYQHNFPTDSSDLYYSDLPIEAYLIHINLNNLTIQYHLVPNKFSESPTVEDIDNSCVVADANYVYIITSKIILIYTVDGDIWNTSVISPIYPISCTITIDSKYIYVMALHHSELGMIKYDIHGTFTSLDITNFCVIESANSEFITSITAPNGKIYIQGCGIRPWETLVFNTATDQFETETIDIYAPTNTHIPYYRSSQLVPFDDNILLLLYQTNNKYPIHSVSSKSRSYTYQLYFAVTDLISINFVETSGQDAIWPSDPFVIKYYLNDFNNYTNNIYNITFYSNVARIKAFITLNKSNDNCCGIDA